MSTPQFPPPRVATVIEQAVATARLRQLSGQPAPAADERPAIRLINGRRMQCKDIPDEAFLDAVRRTPACDGTLTPESWRMRWNVHAELERVLGPIPENLLLAKARKLMAARKLGGCPCGCRGDYHLPCGQMYCSDACDPRTTT